MKIINAKNAAISKNPHNVGVSKIYTDDVASVAHVTLEAGQVISSHVTAVNVIFYILEGEPTIEIGGEREKVAADNMIESPANIPHAVINESGKRVRFLLVKLLGSKV